MRNLFYIIIALMLVCCNAKENDSIPFGDAIIYGEPKVVKYLSYHPTILENGEISKGGFLLESGHLQGAGYMVWFDAKGRNTKIREYFDGDTIPTFQKTRKYLPGNKMRYEEIHGPPPYTEERGKSLIRMETYNEDNKIIESSYFFQGRNGQKDRMYDQYIYKYDEYGTLVERVSNGYTKDLNNTDSIVLDGTKTTKYMAEYKNGKLVRYGEEPPYYTYTYYEDGSKKREELENDITYTEYYPNGLVKKRFNSKDYYIQYDETGYVKKMVRYNDVYTANYDMHDNKGNWTRMIVYKNGKPTEYGEREIVYYD